MASGMRGRLPRRPPSRVIIACSAMKPMTIDLRAFGGSALTADIAVPKDALGNSKLETRNSKPGEQAESTGAIPITYVPARNTVFLSFALGLAEVTGAFDIFLGVNAVDYSGYPDCRPEFIEAFEKLANLATKAGVERQGVFKVHAPLIHFTKAEIIRTRHETGQYP